MAVATDVDGIPQTRKGNPIPGKFAYSTTHDPRVTEYLYTIPIASEWRYPNMDLKIAAYVAVKSSSGSSEGAWAEGAQFEGANWATYFNYSRDLSAAEVCSLIQDHPEVIIIDVRSEDDYNTGHIKVDISEAIRITYSVADPTTFIDEINTYSKGKMYLVYCNGGKIGGMAAAAMKDLGFSQVYNMAGGFLNGWKKKTCP